MKAKKTKTWTCDKGHRFDKPIRKETKWEFWYTCPECESRKLHQIIQITISEPPPPNVSELHMSSITGREYSTNSKRGFEVKPNGIKDIDIEKIKKKNSTNWSSQRYECPRCGNIISRPDESIGAKINNIVCKFCGYNL
jgi:transcription elongation factor Elf1